MTRGHPTIETLYGKHKDETIVVIGNSSSLLEMDLAVLDGYTTIGVNRLLSTYIPIYLVVVDKSVLRDEHERMRCCQDRVTYLLWPGLMGSDARKLYDGPWISTGPMQGQLDPTNRKGPISIGHVGNSGYESTQIAYRMGAKRILLAGIDLYWPHDRATHSFGSGQKAGCRLHKPDVITEDFVHLKELYAIGGIEVASISPWNTTLRARLGYVDPATLA